uniref:Ig-like domain-containing protein n=1 Tax=Amphiprion ocellaris TaxID=80972 RepID=A0AAQ6AI85_AMPOC
MGSSSDTHMLDQVYQTSANIYKKKGETAKIHCSHSILNYNSILWYKQLENRQLQFLGYVYYNNAYPEAGIDGDANPGRNCTLTTEKLELSSSAIYFCAASLHSARQCCANYEAYFGQGTKLTVLDPDRPVTPPKVKILQPSQQECRNQKEKQRKKTLVCVASGFYPDHVTVSWKINDEDYSSGVATDSAAQEIEGSYRITSRFKVNAALWENQENSFMCIVSFFDGETTTNHTATLHGVQG